MNKGQVTSKNPSKIWDKLIYVLIAVIFIAPFFRGLFFDREFYVVSAIIGLTAVFMIGSKDSEQFKIQSYIEYFALAFGAIYIINFPFAYNKELASFELIKNVTYIVVFIIMARAITNRRTMSVVINSLIGSGTLISLHGMAVAFGILDYTGAIEYGSIYSVFQYRNTFGAYMLAMLFLAMGKMGAASKKTAYYYTVCANILFLGFTFSYSRGAWVLLPIVGLFALILMNQKHFSKILSIFVGIIVSTIPFISKIQTAINNTDKSGMTYVLMSCAVISIITFAVWKFEEKLIINKRIAIIALLVMAVGAGGFLMSGKADTVLPGDMAKRLTQINLKTFSVVTRNTFYKDALKIVKDNSLIGSGGGGWTSLYSKYKTYDYYSTQTHNYLLQVMIETGIPGLIAIVGVYATILYQSYLYLKSKDASDKMTFIGILCSLVVLASHSIIDFDMALGGYALAFWILAGLIANNGVFKVNTEEKSGYFKKEKKAVSTKYIVVIASIAIFISSSSFGYAIRILDRNPELNEKSRFKDVLKNLETVSVLNPFKVDVKIDLANTTLFMTQFEEKNEEKRKLFEKSNKVMLDAIEKDGNKFEYIVAESKYYLQSGQIEKAEERMQTLIENHPLNDNTYRLAIDMYYSIADYYFNEKNGEKILEYSKKIQDTAALAQEKHEELQLIKEELLNGVQDISEVAVKDGFAIELSGETKEKIKLANKVLLPQEERE